MSQFEKFGKVQNDASKPKLWKKMVAIGAAATILGGAGGLGVEKASAGTAGEDKGKISSTENTDESTEPNIQNIDEMEKQALACVEKVRIELILHFGSKAFLDKTTIEYGGDREKAKAVQAEDVENLRTVKVDVLPLLSIIEKAKKLKTNVKGEEVWAFYDPSNHKITVPEDVDEIIKINNIPIKKTMEDYIREELIHSATKLNVSESATKLLEESYEKEGFLGLIKSNIDKYFSDPSERLARKQILDKELLEQLGKGYDEEFTEQHYNKMMDAYKAGKFSFDTDQFISRTLKEFKIFKKIIDEIAKNESGKSPEFNQV